MHVHQMHHRMYVYNCIHIYVYNIYTGRLIQYIYIYIYIIYIYIYIYEGVPFRVSNYVIHGLQGRAYS